MNHSYKTCPHTPLDRASFSRHPKAAREGMPTRPFQPRFRSSASVTGDVIENLFASKRSTGEGNP